MLVSYRHDAAVSYFALDMLKLDGRMNDMEFIVELLFNIQQDLVARGHWDVCDRNVTRESMALGPDAPHMQIMHVVHA